VLGFDRTTVQRVLPSIREIFSNEMIGRARDTLRRAIPEWRINSSPALRAGFQPITLPERRTAPYAAIRDGTI
jgi:hypothetical protein